MQWFRLSASVLIAATLLVCAGYSIRHLQFKLLYYPGSPGPSAGSLQANNIKLWQSFGADYHGLVASNEARLDKGTIVVFHGNGGTALDRIFYMDALGTLGYRVVLAEYPVYGGRKGELGEKAFVNDALEAIRLAFQEYGGPIFLLGESLGCGIAAACARETPVQIEGVILITPWDTLVSIAQSKFPFLPVRLFLRDKYDSVDNLASFKGRIAVVGAERDEVIPIRHARTLYDSLSNASKSMWTLQGVGHNNWYIHVNNMWWKEIMDFVSGGSKL